MTFSLTQSLTHSGKCKQMLLHLKLQIGAIDTGKLVSWIAQKRLIWQNCKSLLCALFHEQTCSRFNRLFGCSVVRLLPCPKYVINTYNAIFLKSQRPKDIQNDILDCQIHKYTFTNTQIHKYSISQSARNTLYVLYFWESNCPSTSQMIFWTAKYTNTAYDKKPEIPNICYIFEQLVVQGYKKKHRKNCECCPMSLLIVR